MYYGAADSVVAAADFEVSEIINSLERAKATLRAGVLHLRGTYARVGLWDGVDADIVRCR